MRLSSNLLRAVAATLVAAKAANSFVLPSSSLSTPRAQSTSATTTTPTTTGTTTRSTTRILKSESNDNNSNNPDEIQDKNQDKKEEESEAWDANVDYDKEWPEDQAPPDPSSAWDALPNLPQVQASDTTKLGIDISLEPLSQAEAEELREQAKEIISSNIDRGIEDIETLRKRMNKDLEQNARVMQVASELRADEKSKELMSKIDKLTEGFLESTKESRTSTKMAAAASKAMEGRDVGIEMGTWGTLGGRTVVASSRTSGTGTLLGSVDNAILQSERMEGSEEATTNDATEVAVRTENRIVVIADMQQVRDESIMGTHN
jgi:hypothetical protein